MPAHHTCITPTAACIPWPTHSNSLIFSWEISISAVSCRRYLEPTREGREPLDGLQTCKREENRTHLLAQCQHLMRTDRMCTCIDRIQWTGCAPLFMYQPCLCMNLGGKWGEDEWTHIGHNYVGHTPQPSLVNTYLVRTSSWMLRTADFFFSTTVTAMMITSTSSTMTRSSAPPTDAPIVIINVWDEVAAGVDVVASEVASGGEVDLCTSLIISIA